MDPIVQAVVTFLAGVVGAYGTFKYLSADVDAIKAWRASVGPDIEVLKSKMQGMAEIRAEIKAEMKSGFANMDRHMATVFDSLSAQKVALADKVGRVEFEGHKSSCGARIGELMDRVERRLEKMDETRDEARAEDGKKWETLLGSLSRIKALNDLMYRMDSDKVHRNLDLLARVDLSALERKEV
jgi:hypothetical protein